MLLDNIEIIVGTYEEFLLGYKPKLDDSVYSLKQTFATHRHTASVRCVASNGAMMASGGSDEYVHLYDMAQRKEIGTLMHHSGTVSCLAYTPDGSHLLSGGNDGVLAIHRVAGFVLEKTWHSAHKGEAILGISVHPSGKLALTVGSDATLQTWNLIKGRRVYGTRLGSSKMGAGWLVTGVCWNMKGTFYAVGMGAIVDVYCVESAAVVYSIMIDCKACSFCFINNLKLCIGSENGMMYAHNVKKKTCLSQQKAHDQRVKSVGSVSSKDEMYVVSASSNGEIKLWHYKGDNFQELCKVATGCRITCLTIPTCGYPSHFKEECEEDNDMHNMLDEERNQSVGTRPNVRGVVIIEEEDDDDDDDLTVKRQTKKRKKRGKTSAKDKDEHEDLSDKIDVKILSEKKKKMGGDDDLKDPCFDDTDVKTQTKKKKKIRGDDYLKDPCFDDTDVKTQTKKKKKIRGDDDLKDPCFDDTDVKTRSKKKKKIGRDDEHMDPPLWMLHMDPFDDTDVKIQPKKKKKKGIHEDEDPCNVNMDITVQSKKKKKMGDDDEHMDPWFDNTDVKIKTKKKKKISSEAFSENGSWLETESLTKERKHLSLTCQDDVVTEKQYIHEEKKEKCIEDCI